MSQTITVEVPSYFLPVHRSASEKTCTEPLAALPSQPKPLEILKIAFPVLAVLLFFLHCWLDLKRGGVFYSGALQLHELSNGL